MKKPSLASQFADLREKSGMSMLAVANRCDLAETTIWKIENGRSVRWETVHLALTSGLRIPAGTSSYEACHALWLQHRQEIAESKPEDAGKKRMSRAAVSAVNKFRKIVHDLDEAEIKRIIAAARRAANRK